MGAELAEAPAFCAGADLAAGDQTSLGLDEKVV